MQCKKCNANFPCSVIIEGKKFNLKNRKYCFDCSAFKSHNTKKLELNAGEQNELSEKKCILCNKIMFRKKERKGKLCWTCTNRKSRSDKIEKIKQIVGDSCWFCGYSKCWQAMDFHHVNPEDKLFPLSTREMQFSWERIKEELKKCALVCSCCHREIHCGLVDSEQVKQVWKERWTKIEHQV